MHPANFAKSRRMSNRVAMEPFKACLLCASCAYSLISFVNAHMLLRSAIIPPRPVRQTGAGRLPARHEEAYLGTVSCARASVCLSFFPANLANWFLLSPFFWLAVIVPQVVEKLTRDLKSGGQNPQNIHIHRSCGCVTPQPERPLF